MKLYNYTAYSSLFNEGSQYSVKILRALLLSVL